MPRTFHHQSWFSPFSSSLRSHHLAAALLVLAASEVRVSAVAGQERAAIEVAADETGVSVPDPLSEVPPAPAPVDPVAPIEPAPAGDVPLTPTLDTPIMPETHTYAVPQPEAYVPAAPATLFGGPWDTRPKLLGDMYGVRPHLAESGIAFDGNVTQFYQGVTSGGIERDFRYGGHADYYVNVDGQKAGLWPGLFVTMHVETVFGQSANSLTGTLLPVSLIQALPKPNEPVTSITALKVTQALSPNFVTYFGKLNAFDDFAQRYAGGRGIDAFMNTSFLFNPVLARTIPYSTLGLGAAYLQEGQPVASLTLFDSNTNTTSSGFDEFFDNGVVIVGQLTKPTSFWELPGHQSVGFSYSNARYRSLDRSAYLNNILSGVAATPTETGSAAFFYQFDQTVVMDCDDPSRSWGFFGNAGLADRNPSPIRWFANIGIGGNSLACGRPQDTFGVGYFYVGVNDSLKDLAPALVPLRDEQGVELFYNYAVTPWLHVTPDLQVIVPARERTLPPNAQDIDTSVVFGIRTKIVF